MTKPQQKRRAPVLDPVFATGARVAAQLLVLTGLLHLAVGMMHGLSADTFFLAIVGLLFIVFGGFAFRNVRWAKFAGPLLAVIDAFVAYVATLDVPRSWTNIYLAIDLLIIVFMGLHLWRTFQLSRPKGSAGN